MQKLQVSSKLVLLGIFGLLACSLVLMGAAAKGKTPVNLNTATEKELTALPGIGAATAKKIIAARPFKSVDDLKNVSGIGQSKFDALKDLVTVEAAAKPVKTATKADTASAGSKVSAKETKAAAGQQLVDINSADEKTLESLPGIGPATAKKIIAARPFKSVDDLKNVSGIGQSKFDALKDQVTVGAAKRAATTSTTTTTTSKTETTTKETKAAAGQQLVDINSADEKTLEVLPGVGPATAKKIIAARPFKSVDDLKNVSGIGQAKFDALKDQVVIGSAKAAETEEAVNVKAKPGQKININTASKQELDSLLGIGPVKAQAIIDGRPYAKIEDIMKVKGIKEGTFAKIKDYIIVK